MTNRRIVFFDTETTGKAELKRAPEDVCQPDIVQLAAALWDEDTQVIWTGINAVVHPHLNADPAQRLLFRISDDVAKIHGITHQHALDFGQPRRTLLSNFNFMCRAADTIVAHNLDFDWLIMQTAYYREGVAHRLGPLHRVCTMRAATDVVRLPKPDGWKGKPKPGDMYKWPTLTECYQHFFGERFEGAHNAMNDVIAMMKVWRELRKAGAL